jgi:transposase-like protein
MRFTEEEKLTIIGEGEKTGVKTVCAKYDISDQAYREWRYKARGIQPKKHHSPEERPKALKEAQKVGIKAVCVKYGTTPQTYRVWRYEAQSIKPRKHFSPAKKLKILKEGCQKGVYRTCAVYRIDPVTYLKWKRKFGFNKAPRRGRPQRFNDKEKLRILEDGFQNGISQTCAAHGIEAGTYYYWKRRLNFQKSPRRFFSEEERRLVVNDAIQDGITKAGDKHDLWGDTIHRWAGQLGLEIPDRRPRFSSQEKLAIVREAERNGPAVTCRAYKIAPETLRNCGKRKRLC